MKRSAPRPSSTCACSAKSCRRRREAVGSPSGPIEPAMKTSRPVVSRAFRASLTAVELIRSSSSSRKCCESFRRLAPKVFVSISSAPALMKPTCSETTASGARRFASSGQRRRGAALEMSAPIPPSATIGGPLARRSRNRLGTRRTLLSGRRRPGCRGQAEQSSVERVIDEAAGRRDTRIANAKRPRCGGGGAADATPGGPDAAGGEREKKKTPPGGGPPPPKPPGGNGG